MQRGGCAWIAWAPSCWDRSCAVVRQLYLVFVGAAAARRGILDLAGLSLGLWMQWSISRCSPS